MDYHRRAARHPAFPIEEAAEMLYDDEKLLPEQIALRHERRLHYLTEEKTNKTPVLSLHDRGRHGWRCLPSPPMPENIPYETWDRVPALSVKLLVFRT